MGELKKSEAKSGSVRDELKVVKAQVKRLRQRQARLEQGLADERSESRALVESLRLLREELARRDDETLSLRYDLRATAVPTADDPAPPDYLRLVRRIREVVRRRVPKEARLLVVSKGDDELLDLYGRRAGHFPRDEQGDFAGEYPGTSAAAIAAFETQRAGADYLMFPATAFWWLDHYKAFGGHLETNFEAVHRDSDCVIFSLNKPGRWTEFARLVAEFKARHHRFPAILSWQAMVDLSVLFPQCAVFAPPPLDGDELPYIEESIDVVAVAAGNRRRVDEARRVASTTVLLLAAAGEKSDLNIRIEQTPITTRALE